MSSDKLSISRLLLCSTDKEKLQPLQQRLAAAGVEVDCAIAAEQARQLLWKRHYDGVAIDLLLPDRDGISFAMELRRENPWLSILVISAAEESGKQGYGPDWLCRSAYYARLVFALKQAGQRAAGHMPSILHVEHDDSLAKLVQNTIGKQTELFRARNTQEAESAMALRRYDMALTRTQLPDLAVEGNTHIAAAQPVLCVNTDSSGDPLLTILNSLRRSPYLHQPAYC